MVSIISLTLVKESNCTAITNVERWARGPAAAPTRGDERCERPCQAAKRSSASNPGEDAARRRAAAARPRLEANSAEAVEANCRRDTDLASISRLSSSVSTAMASATAMVSAERVLERFSICVSRSLQVSFRLRKNSTSSERWLRVNARSSLASESAFALPASSACISSSFFLPASISEVFAAARALKSSCALTSSFCAVLSSLSNSSSI
mmetsp:Transcript_17537/g.44098  ORF Transcript_17537/g.44098 Transcript_17537/m.44098 type:complete len:210 (-) Transcript_17537:673-1302(-)